MQHAKRRRKKPAECLAIENRIFLLRKIERSYQAPMSFKTENYIYI